MKAMSSEIVGFLTHIDKGGLNQNGEHGVRRSAKELGADFIF